MTKVDVWLIVGARRWARVMASELCTAAPKDSVIQLLGDLHDVELRQWLRASRLGERIQVVESMRPCPPSSTGVALIVNSAYQHRSSIQEALSAGYNVVSEKPMSFSQEATRSLLNQAKTLGLALFCTNTYLFADYLGTFKKNWLANRTFTAMRILWTDAAREVRYGETKGYDSSVPVIFDVLPHIANIIVATLGVCNPVPVGISVCRGGSAVSIQYRHEDLNIYVQIARNAGQRTRCIKFSGSSGSEVVIDFTREPGLVSADKLPPISADADWRQKRRPIAAMFSSLLEFFESGKQDERLSPLAGLFGNALIDGIVGSYVDQQIAFLAAHGDREVPALDEDFSYAEKESRSIAKRALPLIESDSPLRQLAMVARTSATSNLAH
jgi:predicted dehydrogenase